MNIPDPLPALRGPDRLTALRRTLLDTPSGLAASVLAVLELRAEFAGRRRAEKELEEWVRFAALGAEWERR